MKKPSPNPAEHKCPECNGTGFPTVVRPEKPGVRIYPAPCEKCGGKGRISDAAREGLASPGR
jgi:DnaJ-class molecular chaperone